MAKKCPDHLFKAIFKTVDMAHNYMATYHPYRVYEIYRCPAFPKGHANEHYHTRDYLKRKRKARGEFTDEGL